MTNTPRMTSKHMDTMDELRDSVRQFVGKGKVVSIEEGRMLRLVQAASGSISYSGRRKRSGRECWNEKRMRRSRKASDTPR